MSFIYADLLVSPETNPVIPHFPFSPTKIAPPTLMRLSIAFPPMCRLPPLSTQRISHFSQMMPCTSGLHSLSPFLPPHPNRTGSCPRGSSVLFTGPSHLLYEAMKASLCVPRPSSLDRHQSNMYIFFSGSFFPITTPFNHRPISMNSCLPLISHFSTHFFSPFVSCPFRVIRISHLFDVRAPLPPPLLERSVSSPSRCSRVSAFLARLFPRRWTYLISPLSSLLRFHIAPRVPGPPLRSCTLSLNNRELRRAFPL